MIYRDDVEALEARCRALDAELAERKQARDEVARMLAEARAHERHDSAVVDHLMRRSAQQRRHVGLFLMIVLLIMGGAAATYIPTVTERDRAMQLLDRVDGFADRICACRDAACVQHVNAELSAWAASLSHEPPTHAPSSAATGRMQAISDRLAHCMKQVLTRESASERTSQ